MASAFASVFAVYLVSAFGYGVDSATAYSQCDSDHQCPSGYYCYDESHYCTPCVDCLRYKRKSSWRSCPKTPLDCGACTQGFEEEILHEGKTRDMCVPAMNFPLGQANVSGHSYERYLWAAGMSALLLPIAFYAFCRSRDRGSIHHGLPREEPPPYRSIELTTLTSNNSEERLSEVNHELRVGQQKDSLVQALPFRQPCYESELLAFENVPESNQEDVEPFVDNQDMPAIELHDENTMPSDWTPAEAEDDSNSQLVNFELAEPDVASESEDTCEPASKRHKAQNSPDDDEFCNTQLNINLFINNNVTIHKQS